MKHIKKIWAIILSLIMLIAVVPVIEHNANVYGAAQFEIISPMENSLLGAGHFDIKWSADISSDVKSYDVYIDGKLVGTTEGTSYEFYTTKVKMYDVYVESKHTDGSLLRTDKVSFGVTKKGLCVNNEMGRNLNPVSMNMGWYYSWGTDPFSYRTYKNIEFVPMIWGLGAESSISRVAGLGYKYLLAYNEPDMGGNVGGSNIDVNTAISHWNKFLGYDYHLGSPAPAFSPSWGNGTWLRTFMDSIDHSTIDFIPLHCYYETYGGAAGANTFLTEVVDATYKMYHKPIWITEFAVSGWGYNNKWARESVNEFLETVIKGLNERDYVERYSWFSFDTTDGNNGASALWTNSTGKLTDLGQTYVQLGNPEGYAPTPIPVPNYKISDVKRTTLLSDEITIKGVTCEDYLMSPEVSVSATSEQGNGFAKNAIDNDIMSRWESIHGIDPQTFTIDLGRVKNIKQFNILWEDASAKNYHIQVSTDGKEYVTVAEAEEMGKYQNRCDTITLNQMTAARYVRIVGTARTTNYGYSIYDIAIYGTDDVSVDETPAVETSTPRPTGQPTTEEVTAKPGRDKETTKAASPQIRKTKVKKAVKKKTSVSIKISLKKIAKANRYQIKISNSKKFKKILVKKTVKKVKFTVKSKKIKRRRKLYVKARAIRVVNKKKSYGKWSNVKKVKIIR